MIDYADLVAVNKFDRRGSEDALRDVCKQVRRERGLDPLTPMEEMPVFGTMASRFNDPGVNAFYKALMLELQADGQGLLREHAGASLPAANRCAQPGDRSLERVRYLGEISDTVRHHHGRVESQARGRPSHGCSAKRAQQELGEEGSVLDAKLDEAREGLEPELAAALRVGMNSSRPTKATRCVVRIRDKEIRNPLRSRSLSGTAIPQGGPTEQRGQGRASALPAARRTCPAGGPSPPACFPSSARARIPSAQFAGEGPPEQTNRRFHYLCRDERRQASLHRLRLGHPLR